MRLWWDCKAAASIGSSVQIVRSRSIRAWLHRTGDSSTKVRNESLIQKHVGEAVQWFQNLTLTAQVFPMKSQSGLISLWSDCKSAASVQIVHLRSIRVWFHLSGSIKVWCPLYLWCVLFSGHVAWRSHSVNGSKSCDAWEGGEATGEWQQGTKPIQNNERCVTTRENRSSQAAGGIVTLGQGRASWHREKYSHQSEGASGRVRQSQACCTPEECCYQWRAHCRHLQQQCPRNGQGRDSWSVICCSDKHFKLLLSSQYWVIVMYFCFFSLHRYGLRASKGWTWRTTWWLHSTMTLQNSVTIMMCPSIDGMPQLQSHRLTRVTIMLSQVSSYGPLILTIR